MAALTIQGDGLQGQDFEQNRQVPGGLRAKTFLHERVEDGGGLIRPALGQAQAGLQGELLCRAERPPGEPPGAAHPPGERRREYSRRPGTAGSHNNRPLSPGPAARDWPL